MEGVQTNLEAKSRDSLLPSENAPAEGSTAVSKRNIVYGTQEARSASPSSTRSEIRPTIRTTSKHRIHLPPGISFSKIFRYHMGIENDEDLVPGHLAKKSAIDPIATGKHPGRRAVNLGIYNRAIREELGAARSFQIWSIIINLALGCQIIFAAILTALGAASGPSDVVAIFGTLNTIIAGFLTYLKGTGLPNRMKYFHNQWLKLRAYIEQRERDFASDDLSGAHRISYEELLEEIEIIEKMYHNIRKDVEKHTPDSFAGNKGEEGAAGAPGEGASNASLAKKGLHAMRAKMMGGGGEEQAGDDTASKATGANLPAPGIEGRVKGVMEEIEQRISGHLSGHLSKLTEHQQSRNAGGTVASRSNADDLESGIRPRIGDDLDAEESANQGVDEVAITHMRQIQARALEAQEQAERRVRELEQQLANVSGSMAKDTQA